METVARVTIAYVILLAAFRMLGKRELRKMSAFELVTLLFIPQLFSRALTRQDYSFTNAVIAASTLLTLVWVTSAIAYRFRPAARVLEGEARVLVADGVLQADAMDRERVSAKEIFSEMHLVGLTQLAQVRWAILEASGSIAIVPASHGAGVTRSRDTGPQGF